jgi:hypothetical protein
MEIDNHMDIENTPINAHINTHINYSNYLVSMPPEIIDIIYKSTGVDAVRFSMAHPYIYDCRPLDVIEYCKNISIHKKKFKPIIDCIKSMKYIIKEKEEFDWHEIGYESVRVLDNCEITYRCYDKGNLTVTNSARNEFIGGRDTIITLYPLEITVYMNVYNNRTHMLFLKGSVDYLYLDR